MKGKGGRDENHEEMVVEIRIQLEDWRRGGGEKVEEEEEEDEKKDEEEELIVYFESNSSVDYTEFQRMILFPPFFSPLHPDHDVRRSATAPMAHVERESCPNT